jgi:DNA-directed RNA polymerase subunit beta
MNNIFVPNLSNLGEIQHISFYNFLINGISAEMKFFANPFFSYIKNKTAVPTPCLVYLYTKKVKLKGPFTSINLCFQDDLSYTIQLFVESSYSYLLCKPQEMSLNLVNYQSVNKKISIKQDIFLGEIPLMTEEGTFIINGCERIIISQIIRSPGIYFRREFSTINKTLKRSVSYTATIISDKGLWTKFILDTRLDKTELIYLKLADLNISSQAKDENLILTTSSDEKEFKDKLFICDILNFFGLTLPDLLNNVKYPAFIKNLVIHNPIYTQLELKQLLEKYFFNETAGCFSIGTIGRYKINQTLQLQIPKTIEYLTLHDFLGIINGLIELKYFDKVNDDIDDLKHKQIRSVGELLQIQFRGAIFQLKKQLLEFYANKYSEQEIDLPDETSLKVVKSTDSIFESQLITNTFKDFFVTSQLSQYMDQINPLSEITHKRRISVFGPNGLKRDNISNIIRDIHPSQYGRLCYIETPEGQNAGLISALSLYSRISSLGVIDVPYFLADKGYVSSNYFPIFLNPEQEFKTEIAICDTSITPTRILSLKNISVKAKNAFFIQKTESVEFLTTSPLQILSLGAALIPFLEHDDANRALMGSNMQRQAVPLLFPQKPIVGTSYEMPTALDSGMVIKSLTEGIVVEANSSLIIICDTSNQKIKYLLKKFWRSNQETSLNQRPLVWSGESIYAGQIIADGPAICEGELSLGRNLLVAYMPWEGYNYEDAIVINERLIIEDCLTSIHLEEVEVSLTNFLLGTEKLTRNLPNYTKHVRRNLTLEGIIKLGSYVSEGDILVGKVIEEVTSLTAELRLLHALSPDLVAEKNYKDTSVVVPSGLHGRIVGIKIVSAILDNTKIATTDDLLKITIAQTRKIELGDKLAGRHGNKGIISRILPSQDMPYLEDGTSIDILLNPLGVPSRMNVGQVFECLLGFAGAVMGTRFLVSPFDEIYGSEASRILINQKLKEAAIRENANWIFNPITPGKMFVRDGRTGEYFDNPITVGKSFILKLIHLVEDKIFARSTGPYTMITEQPLGGKSQQGGQRFGEMEVWALEAYGCSSTLQELLTIKSDDIDARNDMYNNIITKQTGFAVQTTLPESFLTLIRELNALGLDFSFYKIDSKKDVSDFSYVTQQDIFSDIEQRLQLRTLLTTQILKNL